jgi:predicted porin
MTTTFHLSARQSARLSALALATLGAFASGAASAQSSVTLYGAIGLDMLMASNVYNGSTLHKMFKIDDNAIVNSRIGIKGMEDLGGGTKAIFDLESSVSPDTGSARSAFWNRNAYVGLSGDYGTIKLGHQWNVSDDYMCSYFVCAYYSPFLMSGFYAISDYYDNVIKYTSPNYGGLEGAVLYSTGEKAGHDSAGQKFQAALNYGSGPIGVGATAFSEKDPNAGPTNTLYELGGFYDFGAMKLRLGVAHASVKYFYNSSTSVTTTTGAFQSNLVNVGLDVPVSANARVSFDLIQNNRIASKDDTAYLRIRGEYSLSKRTTLNANVIYLDNKGNANFAFITDGQGFSGYAGQDQSILTMGITHAF